MFLTSIISLVLALGFAGSAPQSPRKPPPVPETFTANAHVAGAAGASAATLTIQVDRYVTDHDRDAIRSALKTGGYSGFLTALRAAPALGQVKFGNQTFTVRWATQEALKNGRRIVVITDKPVYFAGGGAANAKPRDGYEVALIRFEVDSVGLGSGEMAAAARVKPGGETGVIIDDYSDAPIKLTTVTKAM